MTDKKEMSAPQKALLKLGLARDIDLALHLPLRYEDETRIVKLSEAREGDTAQIEATVTACEVTFRPRRQLLVTVDDGSDTCVLRFFNFYPSQQKALAVGTRIRARGELKGGFLGWTMMHPSFRAAGGELPNALTPVYSTVAGLPQAYLRRAVLGGLARADLSDTFPPGVAVPEAVFSRKNGQRSAWGLRESLSFLHQPAPDVALATLEDHSHPAWQRLKAEELLAQQLSQLQSKRERARHRAPALAAPAGGLHEKLLAVLPFQLTRAQHRVGEDIARDLARPVPMHRLLQGDVGSGKTVVAALAAAICIDAGRQCALMAPTEILAEQHFRKLIGWLEPLGVRVAWLTGGQKKKERAAMLALIASGEAGLVVGTHAVIQDQVQFRSLALAIIDEQHRFGVAQRLALRGKMQESARPGSIAARPPQGDAAPSGGSDPRSGGAWGLSVSEPHLLMMTATPIPRTLAMSYYADLDVSTIDELPPGRTPIVTKVIAEQRREQVVERIRAQLAQGRQVYWVCPLIEESETVDLTNATATHEALSAALPGVMVGLLHSRMPAAEKKAVMSLFTGGQMGVLVSTTVIEVGVDVPNASLMVIEHAERFGLSQLHQLRGRVGRGAAASACVLLYSAGDSGRLGETARARLKAMAETGDGFEIARRDLDIRGPGEFLGARQSGAALLRFADLATDTDLLEWARATAPAMLDRHLEWARRHAERWLGGKSEYLKA
ncbi:ATP-dependent DNA helicase RecG [Variovorax terrae]|uniref:ATP-dependent DNA helicase RecG n=1 Tax=Variovorax terrae TaxID=2923278 RepID=A0A9X1W220_9BURK|nr:ATP-dependent DNA helicase RecG [Variovorax terrae]MCJ0764693.1 ATP-dependent DNA helicase RecG [Variovorax terrae]